MSDYRDTFELGEVPAYLVACRFCGVDLGGRTGPHKPDCPRATPAALAGERAAVLEGGRRIAELERERDEARARVDELEALLEVLRPLPGALYVTCPRAALPWLKNLVPLRRAREALAGRVAAARELETAPECNRLAAGRPNGPGCGCRPGVCTLEPASECGRDLHGYRGPRCRYCDGTAE